MPVCHRKTAGRERFEDSGARAAPDPRPRTGPWDPPPGLPAGPHTALPRRTEPRDGSLPRNPLSRQGPRCFPGGRGRTSGKQPGEPPAAGAAFAFPPCRARNPRRPPLALRAHRRLPAKDRTKIPVRQHPRRLPEASKKEISSRANSYSASADLRSLAPLS